MRRLPSSFRILPATLGILLVASIAPAQTIDVPIMAPKRVFVLQNYVDNFNFGLKAGGELRPFGKVLGEFVLQDGVGNRLKPHSVTGVDTAAYLSTIDEGFGASSNQDFIGFSKRFATATNLESKLSSNTIDASGFKSISYFVKNAGDTSYSEASVSLELVIGDGGDVTTTDNEDKFTGSVWGQAAPKPIASIKGNSEYNEFERIDLTLNGSIKGIKGGFKRIIGPTDKTTHTNLTSELLKQITGVNIVMHSGGESGIRRAILVDDISFSNFSLVVEQEKVFTKPDNTTTIIKFITTLTTNSSKSRSGKDICFTINQDIANQTCVPTNDQGQAVFNFPVTPETAIFTIDVEPVL
ncbi:MAG: hypothetical protein GKS05_00225 [Nitrospirales bacterium]|nr:hypothetical protein [Nitrospirales bacterium]